MVSAAIVTAMLVGVVTTFAVIKYFRDNTRVPFMAEALGALNGMLIALFNEIYTRFAVIVTKWENYRTEGEFSNMLAQRTFAFQFFNSFFTLVWQASPRCHVVWLLRASFF